MAKEINVRVGNKYDTTANWERATFIPLKGELIIYAPDNEHPYERIKIGDGVTPIGALNFLSLSSGGSGEIPKYSGVLPLGAYVVATEEITDELWLEPDPYCSEDTACFKCSVGSLPVYNFINIASDRGIKIGSMIPGDEVSLTVGDIVEVIAQIEVDEETFNIFMHYFAQISISDRVLNFEKGITNINDDILDIERGLSDSQQRVDDLETRVTTLEETPASGSSYTTDTVTVNNITWTRTKWNDGRYEAYCTVTPEETVSSFTATFPDTLTNPFVRYSIIEGGLSFETSCDTTQTSFTMNFDKGTVREINIFVTGTIFA